jgi:hypothetical protein
MNTQNLLVPFKFTYFILILLIIIYSSNQIIYCDSLNVSDKNRDITFSGQVYMPEYLLLE